MKLLLSTIFAVVFLAVATTHAQEAKAKTKETEAKEAKMKKDKDKTTVKEAGTSEPVNYAYTPSYSSQFVMGSPAHGKMVLDLMKGFEKNDFSADALFADTVMVLLSDGTGIQGKTNVIPHFQKMRAGLSNTSFDISAVVPLKSVDRNEDWVAVWGTQDMTTTDGTHSANWFQCIWRINKDGKVDYIQFYEAKPVKQ